MPILNTDIKSYNVIFTGEKESLIQSFEENNINDYIFLNKLLIVVYTKIDFDENIFESINQVVWWESSYTMSSLINIEDDLKNGVSTLEATNMLFMGNSLYNKLQGDGIVVAIIDSGIDYLNPDFINEDNTSKILYIWDQESDYNLPPENMLFGSEFTREQINEAIANNDSNLSKDEIGTGTMASAIISSNGKTNPNYKGIAPKTELIVVKLRSYISRFKEGVINYKNTDFLVAISYIIKKFKEISKPIIINFTLGVISGRGISQTLLNTFEELYQSGFILVSGAGNQGNTDIHYSGNVSSGQSVDVNFQVGDDKNLIIIIDGHEIDRFNIAIISPLGEISTTINYSSNFTEYTGNFNLENVKYSISYSYPWLSTGSMQISIKLENVYSGIWAIRIMGADVINGNFDAYLPNKNLISQNTRFIDSDSNATITRYGLLREAITVGAYNTKSNSMWIGSSKGPEKTEDFILDIVAPGVDIISICKNNTLKVATGTGVSSSVVCAVIALLIEFIINQTQFYRLSTYSEPIKTYLMLGATQKSIYKYPNSSYGYGILNYQSTLEIISKNL